MEIQILNKEQFDQLQMVNYESLFGEFQRQGFHKVIMTHPILQPVKGGYLLTIYFTVDNLLRVVTY